MEQMKMVSSFEWLATHGKAVGKYEGQWIAILGHKVIDASTSLKALLANPKVKKVRATALITRVPTAADAYRTAVAC